MDRSQPPASVLHSEVFIVLLLTFLGVLMRSSLGVMFRSLLLAVFAVALLGVAPTSAQAQVTITPGTGTYVDFVTDTVNFSLSSTGGTSPYTYAVISGTLPGGTTLSSAGLFSGTFTTAGTFVFTIRSTAANSLTGTATITLVISPALVITVPPATSTMQVGTAVSASFVGSGGGGAPYTFAVTGGTLPAGLTLSAAGALTGTPTTAGPFSFTVTLNDGVGNSTSQTVTGTVAVPVPTMPQWGFLLLAMGLIALAVRSMSSRLVAR